MPDRPTTRRGFLIAAGTAALAGCSALGSDSDTPEEIRATALPDVPEDPDPVLAEDIPVSIERETLRDASTRVNDLLATLPLPMGPTDVPNGHVRERLVEAAEGATRRVDDARTAGTRLAALESLRAARADARYAAAGWAFVEHGRSRAELRAEHQSAVGAAGDLDADRDYRGDDPVRAVVVHARVERSLGAVLGGGDPSVHHAPGTLLNAAEWGEEAEGVRARVEDTRYLYDRYTSSLAADAAPVEATFASAAAALTTALRQRRDELPPEPTDSDRTLARRIRRGLRRNAESTARNAAESGGPASTVLRALEGLTVFGAYDRIRARSEDDDGEGLRATEGADVRRARSAAVDAISAALRERDRPELARPVLADAARFVAAADRELARIRRDVRPRRLDDPVSQYVAAGARARSVPAACERVVRALEP